ncbi:TPA: restriction endonuclease subunit S [Staphylococcus aureus]|uniref:restriction endonuclease subunit S n=2 Tax=Staphylococcus aureus TaxID=1280 RepID=UPI000B13FECE|nr:restriction endonuclease subunit S [Staphylococcus aureus]MCR0728275.1 restriction endonuclease subunit S [Staphylococcus aureus]CAC7044182.1 BcgI-like restriction enzyme subunit beta [Staphylococcus aureus]
MMKLSDREWKAFTTDELFSIKSGTTSDFSKLNLKNDSKLPCIGAKYKNNGVVGFANNEELKVEGNALVFIKTGEGSVGLTLYKTEDFIPHKNVYIGYNVSLNKYIGLFIATMYNKQKFIYNYGYGLNQLRVKRRKILLPSKNNSPDYEFMERYIKEKYFNLKLQIKEKQKHKVNDWRELDEVEWEKFTISQLFNNQIGKNIDGNKIDKQSGRTPYITRKESNNGLDGFINDDYRSKEKLNLITRPVITIGNETAKPFVQNYNFYTGTKVNILTPLGTRNIFSTRFIAIMLEQQKSKYSYSFTINSRRLKKQIINLPTKNNRPDYEFMEQYMKRKENEILDRL